MGGGDGSRHRPTIFNYVKVKRPFDFQLTVQGGRKMGADIAQLYSKAKYQSDPFNLHLAYTVWVDGADIDQLYIIYTPRIKPVASIKLYINWN